MLVAESTSAVTFVYLCPTLCLFGQEVGDHVWRRSQGGSCGDIAQLDMLAAEVDGHVNVAGLLAG